MRVLGVDVSTKTGLVLLDGDTIVFEELMNFPPEQPRFKRYERYRQAMLKVFSEFPLNLAVFEGYGYANPYTLATLVEIGTVLRSVAYQLHCPVIEVPPMTLKKFVTGTGNAKKDLMLLETYKRWGFESKDDNIVDAYALARAGQALIGELKGMPQVNDKALDAVRKSHADVCKQVQQEASDI